MEMRQIKAWLKKYQKPVLCIRILILYWLFLFIATHSGIFDSGLNPINALSIFLIGLVVVYRLLAIAFVPAILIFWFSDILFANRRAAGKIPSEGLRHS